MASEPTVFIVDDDPAVRDALRLLMESVGLKAKYFSSGEEFLKKYDATQSGCAVIDIRMPGLSGLDLQEKLIEENIGLPLIFLTGHGDVPMAVRAMSAGAVTFLEKPFNNQALLEVIARALKQDHENRLRRGEIGAIKKCYAKLTRREKQVLDLVVSGRINKQIAAELGIHERTVEAHRAHLMKKFEADSVATLVRMAVTAGLFSQNPAPTPAER